MLAVVEIAKLVMGAVMPKNRRTFYDLQGIEVKLNDRVWYDPTVVLDKSLCEKTFIVVGLSKNSDDILLVPEDDHTDLHKTLSYSVTHNNPNKHEA